MSTNLASVRLQATSLGDLLLLAADAQPDRAAVILPYRRKTYVEIRDRAIQHALCLQQLGVGPGDHVGLLLPTGMDFVELMFAISLLGAVTVPVNARYQPPELAYVVENADLRLLLTTDKIAEAVNFIDRLNQAFPQLAQSNADQLELDDAPLLRNVVLFGSSSADGMLTQAQFEARAVHGDLERLHMDRLQIRLGSTALMLYTSGTTANPKGCMISHEAIVRNSAALADRYELTGEDSFWSPLPLFHIAAILPLAAIFAKGGTYVTTNYFQAGEALKMMEEEKVTATYPCFWTIMSDLVDHPDFDKTDLSRVLDLDLRPVRLPETGLALGDRVADLLDVRVGDLVRVEMLSGKRPYDVARRALIEAVRVICEEKPASLRGASLNSRVIDPDIETIVGKALEKESNRRYGSAAELSGDIGRFLTSQPILARPPSAVYQMQKLVSRHRVPATMAGVMLVALIGFVIGMSVLYVRAVRAEADASRQAETATRALDFMTGMFETSDPSEAKGNVVTAREVLDAGARRIDLDLADQPVVQATLMRTMGEVYYNLGLYGESERLLERALEQRRALLGDDHLDTLAAVQALAQLYEDQGKSAEAEQLLADALERSLRLVGPDARVTINIRAQLAGVYQDQGRMEEAEEAHTAAVDAAREHLGPDDHDTLSMISDLASLYNDTARMDQAEELMQDVLEIRRERLGNDHPETLRCVNNLALIYQYQGKYDNSEELFLEVVEAQTRILGAEHQETLLARNNLVVLRVLQGRFDDAETICNEILKLQRDKLGPDHPDVLRSIMNLAVVYQRQNRLDEAKDELLYVLERYREILGDDHPETMMAASNVAVNFMFKGDNDEAERRYRELVERSTRVLGPDHPDTTIAVENLGNVRYRQGDLDESEALVRQVMESRNRVLGPEHPASLRTRGNLSVVLKNKGDLDAAQILAEEAVEIQRKALGNDHFDVANALENLAALRREQGAFGDAATHMREAVRIRRVVYGDESTEVAESLMTLARELLAGEAWAEAEEAGNQALVLRRDILKVAETENLGLRNFLVQMKINQATYAEAEQQALQFYEDVIRLGETDRATKMASKLVTIYEGLGNEAEAARWQRDAGN